MNIHVLVVGFALSLNCTGECEQANDRGAGLLDQGQREELRLARHLYTMAAKRDAQRTNVLSSLESTNYLEIVSALGVLAAERASSTNVAARVRDCYVRNVRNEDWFVRISCIRVLLFADQSKGVGYAKDALKELPLEGKLGLCIYLIGQGKLFGYPVLREGLLTTNVNTRRMTLQLLESYRQYDGQVWNEAGDRINIEGLIQETRPVNPPTTQGNKE